MDSDIQYRVGSIGKNRNSKTGLENNLKQNMNIQNAISLWFHKEDRLPPGGNGEGSTLSAASVWQVANRIQVLLALLKFRSGMDNAYGNMAILELSSLEQGKDARHQLLSREFGP